MPLLFLASTEDRATIGTSELNIIAATYGQLFVQSLQVELQCLGMEAMRELNKTYRQLDEPTDVLSFPTFATQAEILEQPAGLPLLLGSLAVCPAKALAYHETLPQLVHHGILHLLGWDHETEKAAWIRQETRCLGLLAANGLSIPGIPGD